MKFIKRKIARNEQIRLPIAEVKIINNRSNSKGVGRNSNKEKDGTQCQQQ